MDLNYDLYQFGSILLALVIAIPLHEFAHALSAVNNGDDGPRRAGRLSFMPWDHFDIFGFAFCCLASLTGFGIGWGKPVLVNPHLLNNPRWDMCKIALWGPLANLGLAILFGLPLRFGLVPPADGLFDLLMLFVWVNLSLMVFNLIPLGPLDGAKVVEPFLPESISYQYMKFQQQWGFMILFGLIFVGRSLLGPLIREPTIFLARLILGPGFG